jgi:hypothetical protein
LKWYMYNQNNSGGSFTIYPEQGIGETVWVQARNPEEADQRAQGIGLYFDGCDSGQDCDCCDSGQDCDCCGDRWSAQNTYWKGDDGETTEPYIWAQWRKEAVYAHRYDGTFYQVTELKGLNVE